MTPWLVARQSAWNQALERSRGKQEMEEVASQAKDGQLTYQLDDASPIL
jgi:hypothetical protein